MPKSCEINQLPTTPEIAAQGVEAFKAIVASERLPEEIRHNFFNPAIYRCFVGTSPIVGDCSVGIMGDLKYNDYRTIKEVIASVSDNILVIQLPSRVDEPARIVFANLISVKKVMSANKLVFSKAARKDVKRWLTNQQDKWWDNSGNHQIVIRNGLLSGIPTLSAEMYAKKLRVRRNREVINTRAFGGFILFDNTEDKDYISKCEKIYRESRIEQVAYELAKKYGAVKALP